MLAMNFEFFCLTDPGRLRENNEDAVVVDVQQHLAVLADGMGGYNAGEVASAMATTFIKSELGRWLQEGGHKAKASELQRAMEICVDNANLSIYNTAHANPQYAGMGTTLVMGLFIGTRAMIAHVGDSRCYRMRPGTFEQITRDHSLLQEQIDAGLISPEQALVSHNKNLVTRALGVEDAVLLDVAEHEVQGGDMYLFCSDGLSDMLADARMHQILREEGSLESRARRLVDAANEAGGRDNISVILVQASAAQPPQGFWSRLLGR